MGVGMQQRAGVESNMGGIAKIAAFAEIPLRQPLSRLYRQGLVEIQLGGAEGSVQGTVRVLLPQAAHYGSRRQCYGKNFRIHPFCSFQNLNFHRKRHSEIFRNSFLPKQPPPFGALEKSRGVSRILQTGLWYRPFVS